MNRLLPLLLAVALLGPALVAEAQSDRPSQGRGDDRRSPTAPTSTVDPDDADDDSDADDSGRGRGGSDDRGEDGRDRPDRSGPGVGIGSFAVEQTARAVDGDFVAFQYLQTGVRNVSAGGLFLFNATVTGDARAPDEGKRPAVGVRSGGSVVGIDTAAYRLQAHDNPNALVRFESESGFVLDFPPGTTLRAVGESVEVIFADGRTGRVIGDDLAVAGSAVTGEDRATFLLDAKRGAFDVHRKDIGKAMAKRAVGAEVTIGKPDPSTGRVREEVVTFANVTVTTLAQRGNVTLIVDGHGFDGRVIVVNVDPELFGLSNGKDFSVLFDNVSMRQAEGGVADVLDPDDDGLQPEYLLVQHDDGVQLIASIPHYSVHTLTLKELIQEAPPSLVAGFVAATVMVAAGGFVLFRRPKG